MRLLHLPALSRRELKFSGVPLKSNVEILPTANCLVHLVEWPPFVLPLEDIEIVSFERVAHGLRNFDMVFVFQVQRDLMSHKPVECTIERVWILLVYGSSRIGSRTRSRLGARWLVLCQVPFSIACCPCLGFQDYSKPVKRIDLIPIEYLDNLKVGPRLLPAALLQSREFYTFCEP